MKNGCCGGPFLSKKDVEKWILELVRKHGNDPLRICRQEGIRVIYVDDRRDNWDGFLYCEPQICIIGINSCWPVVHRGAALAHELTHYAILKNIRVRAEPGTALENLCDHGAKVLLFGQRGLYAQMERASS